MKKILFVLAVLLCASGLARASALTCSPAPCVTSVVNVSSTSEDFDAMEFTVVGTQSQTGNPLFVFSNYYNETLQNAYCSFNGTNGNASEFGSWTSSDQGGTWSGGCVAPSGSYNQLRSDPIGLYDDAKANLFRGFLAANTTTGAQTVLLYKSTNNGSTWGTPFASLTPTSRPNSTCVPPNLTCPFDNLDFDHMAVDGNDCLYVSSLEFSSTDNGQAIVVAHSCPDTHGNYTTWTTEQVSTIVTPPTTLNFAYVIIGTNNNLLTTWRQCNNESDSDTDDCASSTGGDLLQIYESYSTDGGVTWSTPSNVFSIETAPQISPCTSGLPGAEQLPNTCVRTDGKLFLSDVMDARGANNGIPGVYHEWDGSHYKIRIRNRGADVQTGTWGTKTTLNSNSFDQIYPCAAVNHNDSRELGIGWLSTQNGTNDDKFDAYGVVSKDGGQTWGTIYRLSPTSGNPAVDNIGSPGEFLGDYTGCAWSNSVFYFVYPDTTSTTHHVASIVGLNP